MAQTVTIAGQAFRIELTDPQAFAQKWGSGRNFRWDLASRVIHVSDPGDPFLRSRRVAAAVEALAEQLEQDDPPAATGN